MGRLRHHWKSIYGISHVLTLAVEKPGHLPLLSALSPHIAAHGKSVVFLHPKDWNGVLIELEEA